MGASIPSAQPRRTVTAWSPATISGVTWLAMLALVSLGLVLEVLSISTALALGTWAGIIGAAVNWFRLGQRWTGVWHLLISPLAYLLIPVGLPLALATTVKLSAGSPEHIYEVYQGCTPLFVFSLYCSVAGLVGVYLYRATRRSIKHLNARGVIVEFDTVRPLLALVTISCVCAWGAITLAAQIYLNSITTSLYCDFLQAYRPAQEILPERVEFYQNTYTEREIHFPASEKLTYYQRLHWNNHEYDLWLWAGYDADGNLGWRIKGLARDETRMTCPFTFSQSVTAR